MSGMIDIRTDKAIESLKKKNNMPAILSAIEQFKKKKYRKVKYLNNLIEADHGKLRRLIKPN
jgi:transposase-like protein